MKTTGWDQEMDLEREQEAIYVAMVLGKNVVIELISRSPPTVKQDLAEVRDAIDYVIGLLERLVDPHNMSVMKP